MLQGARIAVVIPAHNEAALIGRVVARMPSFVDLIFVVDDASTDGTSQVAAHRGDDRVQIARHARNRGVGAAIATGYHLARRAGADVIAVMAGDDQMHPDDLQHVLEPVIAQRADYCKGTRLRSPDRNLMPLSRRTGTWCFAHLTRWALGLEALSDSQCGFTAISSGAVARLDLEGLWPGFGYPNDVLAQLKLRGLRTAEVPVRPVYAQENSELRARHAFMILFVIARGAWRVRAQRTRSA